MRRLVGLVLMAALMAPALAVCAGATPTVRRRGPEHDCCPKDEASIAATPDSSSPPPACCRMSADAAQRGAIQAVTLVPPSTVIAEGVALVTPASASRPLDRPDSHPESPHIARHLLLSVLLI